MLLSPQLIVPRPRPIVVAAGGSTTLDPAHADANIALSGGNLIATSGGGATTGSNVRSISSHSTGKFYAEFTATTITNGAGMAVGMVNGTFTIGVGGGGLGANNNSVGYYADGGHVYVNNSSLLAMPNFAPGDVIGMAVDVGGQLVWFRINAGSWNNGSNDPATGTGGVTLAALGAVALFAAVEGENSADVWTANFGGSAYAQTPPSGYGNW